MSETPYQSDFVKAWNVVARVLPLRALSPRLSVDDIVSTAIKTAGHDDLENAGILEGLTTLVDAIGETADLHAFGTFYTKKALVGLLVNRLRLNRLWRHRPEIAREKIERPLIILGLPRTGTSLLVNLLSKDPQHRYLSNWETTASQVPPAGAYTFATDPRRKHGQRMLRFQEYIAPQMKNIHEFHLDGPEECTPFLLQGFTTKALAEMFEVPAYLEWLEGASHRERYEHHKRILQTLQWKYPGERWLLKCPLHMEAIHDLLRTYPDACIVQTHRDPAKVIPSHASLCAAFRGITKASLEPGELGTYVMTSWARYLKAYMNKRSMLDPSRFVDVQYSELQVDPIAAVRHIYKYFGFSLSPLAEDAMQAYLVEQRSRRSSRAHVYTAERYGLTSALVRRSFSDYMEQFNVPLEEHPAKC